MGAAKIRSQVDLDPEQGELVRELSEETGAPVVELVRRSLVLLFRQQADLVRPDLGERLRTYELPRRARRAG